MNCKISIGGTYSSGKTEICNLLIRSNPRSTLVGDHARELKTLLPNIDWTTQPIRDYLLISKLVNEARADTSAGLIVVDGGIINAISHNRLFRLADRIEFPQFLRHRRYDAVFVCNYEDVPLIDDGLRETNRELRIELHKTIIEVANILNYEPILLTGSPKERLDKVLRWIATNHSLSN